MRTLFAGTYTVVTESEDHKFDKYDDNIWKQPTSIPNKCLK